MTVSRVINNTGNIREETRERVLDAIEKLNYHPNSLARGLNNNRINSIGIATSLSSSHILVASSPFFHGLLNGIESSLMKHQSDLVISTRRGHKGTSDYFRLFYERKVDGIILISTYLDPSDVEEMLANKIPCVVIGTRVDSDRIVCIDSDNFQAGKEITERLIEKGHRKIGFIRVSEQNSNVEERYRGFREAMKTHGLEPGEEHIFSVRMEEEEEAGRRVMKAVAAMADPPTAVIASNDFLAIGMIREAQCLGIPIPGDLSVVGFDAMETGRVIQPSLYSMRQPLGEMGFLAAETLIRLIEDSHDAGSSRIFPMEPVPGDSMAPPK